MSKVQVVVEFDDRKISLSDFTKAIEDPRVSIVNLKHIEGGLPKGRAQNYVNGKRNKGITAIALAEQLLKEGPRSIEQIGQVFVARGFALSSASPALSNLQRLGRVRKENGVFSLKTNG